MLLRGYRLAAGLTQEALAERAGMSAEGIGALERGRRQLPYRATVQMLAAALQLSSAEALQLQAAAKPAARPRAGRLAAPPLDSARHNLPASPTRFLGRERELEQLRSLMADHRLVTLTGAGGIGKTRAALEIGSELVARSDSGVWFVDVANIPDAVPRCDPTLLEAQRPGPAGRVTAPRRLLVAAAIARVLNVAESTRQPLLETLTAHLRERVIILILDNCEHVIDDVAAITETLLSNCPQLRILATSREPLRIGFEQAYRLPSLSVPAAAESSSLSPETAVRYSAVELFTLRAQAAGAGFVLTHQNTPRVAEVCRRLDGIPLALEMAAARMNVLGIDALAARLDARFAMLTSGQRTALPRQQTMRALIDWSYDLLSPAEQRLFERLAVFAGGCELAAAAAVHADEADELEVLDLLGSLVDKSLLVVEVAEHEARYRLLESTRLYAREKLAARGNSTLVARRHAQTFAEQAERFERDYGSASDADQLRAQGDLENYRAAMEWAFGRGGDVELGQRIAAAALWPVWGQVSFVEGQRWCQAACDAIDDRTVPQMRATLELCAAEMAIGLGEWEPALAAARRAIAAFTALSDELGAARGLRAESMALLCLGRVDEAETGLHDGLVIARAHRNERLTGTLLEQLAQARSERRDLAQARAHIAEALDIWNAIGAERAALSCVGILAEAEFLGGNLERALHLTADAVVVARRYPGARGVALLLNFAAYLIAANRWDEARLTAREALGLAQDTQRHVWRAYALQHLAAVAVLSANVGAPDLAAIRSAALIVGFVDARVAALGSPREFTEQQEYERVCIALRALLGDEEPARLLADGAALGNDRAVALALSM